VRALARAGRVNDTEGPMSSSSAEPRPAKILDLEVKDARLIFEPVWEALAEEVGLENLRFPKEMILLGGAPGAGKGTQTRFISDTRGLTCPPIVVSELLTTPEMEKIKAQGVMVGDKEVVGLLLRKLLRSCGGIDFLFVLALLRRLRGSGGGRDGLHPLERSVVALGVVR